MKTFLFLLFFGVIVVAWFWHNQPARSRKAPYPLPPFRRKPKVSPPPRARVLPFVMAGALLASQALGCAIAGGL